MKLSRKMDRIFGAAFMSVAVFGLAFAGNYGNENTFAESEMEAIAAQAVEVGFLEVGLYSQQRIAYGGTFEAPGILRVDANAKVAEQLETERIAEEERAAKALEEALAKAAAKGWSPLTPAMGRNRYAVRRSDGVFIERQETYYDLVMSGVMEIAARECGAEPVYSVREDGVKVDAEGYVLVAADLERYPRCSVVETSLGLGRVYDTGTFVISNAEQFDIATDWTNQDGK